MSDDDKTTTDDSTSDATVEPTEEPKIETNSDADDKPAEETSAEEPKTDEPEPAPAEDAAAPAANATQTGATDQQGRTLYNVKCSNCGKDTQVPFQPSGDRPVYCRDCYMQKKNSQA
jgi:CxxC-x17-CxxC domain-containing protein